MEYAFHLLELASEPFNHLNNYLQRRVIQIALKCVLLCGKRISSGMD